MLGNTFEIKKKSPIAALLFGEIAGDGDFWKKAPRRSQFRE